MATATKTFELAAMDAHGGWILCGDYASRDAALRAAQEYHEGGHIHTADDGGSTWGLSSDPRSGHYEERFGIWTDGGKSVVVDPAP